MQNETPTSSPLPESDEPAPDVTDLATAKRHIAMLRKLLAQAAEEAEPLENEIAVFLNPEDMEIARWLFEQRKLCDAQRSDPELEFFDAFQEFVSDWMGVAYDMASTRSQWQTQHPSAPKWRDAGTCGRQRDATDADGRFKIGCQIGCQTPQERPNARSQDLAFGFVMP